MNWGILVSSIFALVYFAWLWRTHKALSRIGFFFRLMSAAGILIILTGEYVNTLPSHAPLRTITGLAWNKTSDLFSRPHSHFILTEEGTDRRFPFTTVIDGPWADQRIRATYVDDGRYFPSVVRIEILSGDQSPWHVRAGYAGWIGTAEAKRRIPQMVEFIGLVLLVAGVFAPASRKKETHQPCGT